MMMLAPPLAYATYLTIHCRNRDQTINILIAKEPKQFGKCITEESSTMVNINAPIGMNKHVSIWTIVSTSLMMEVKEYGSNLKTTIYTKFELRHLTGIWVCPEFTWLLIDLVSVNGQISKSVCKLNFTPNMTQYDQEGNSGVQHDHTTLYLVWPYNSCENWPAVALIVQ